MILDSSMVEHSAVNRVVVGSSPTRGAKKLHGVLILKKLRLHGQAVKTPPFHGGNRGSNPLGVIQILCYNCTIWRHSQVVRQRSATPLSPVQIRLSPLLKRLERLFRSFFICAWRGSFAGRMFGKGLFSGEPGVSWNINKLLGNCSRSFYIFPV